jgi:hypothetical protein
MKKKYVLFLALIIQTVNGLADPVIPDTVKEFMDEYRKASSKLIAETGNRTSIEFAGKFIHYMNYSIISGEYTAVYIRTEDYVVESVLFKHEVEVKYWDLMGKIFKVAKEDEYRIKIIEKVIGEVNNNILTYYPEPKNFTYEYVINKTEDGLKVIRDTSRIVYHIFESDVPILMERLNSESSSSSKR